MIPRHDRPCPCGLTRGQCYEQSISDEGTGHHDERVVACDECRTECPRDVRAECTGCGERVGVHCRDCSGLVLPDELVTVERWVDNGVYHERRIVRLCPTCAEDDEQRQRKLRRLEADEDRQGARDRREAMREVMA